MQKQNLFDRKRKLEKHALRVSQVFAAVAKVSCKHGLWLVAREKKKPHPFGDMASFFSQAAAIRTA